MNLPIIDWPKPAKKKLFNVIKSFLVFKKSPRNDPPPGGDPDLRNLFFARSPKTPEMTVSISDGPNAVKVDFLPTYKNYF